MHFYKKVGIWSMKKNIIFIILLAILFFVACPNNLDSGDGGDAGDGGDTLEPTGELPEDFEGDGTWVGLNSANGWELDGDTLPTIVSTTNYGIQEGSYSAQLHDTNDDGKSSIELIIETDSLKYLKFYYSTSTEDGYDSLDVYIDGSIVNDDVDISEFSGETDWTVYTAPVPLTTGVHTIKFEYDKDSGVNNGEDSIWLDSITLTSDGPPITDPCQTGADGDYTVAVFNSDISGSSSVETCNLISAVMEDKNITTEKEETVYDELLNLRADSENQDKPKVKPQKDISRANVGDTEYFGGEQYVCKQVRTHCDVWLRVDDDHGNTGDGGDIEDTDTDGDGVSLEDYADYFNDYSWQDIHDNFTTNIPNSIDILFKDMGESPAGYYSSGNTIYLNTIVAQNGTTNDYGEPNPLFTNGTLTHEFQHMVHNYNSCGFDLWLNELCSSTAESVWSGQTGIYTRFFNRHASEFDQVSLLNWSSPDHRHRYAIAALLGTWFSYTSKNGSDKGVFFRQLYQNSDFSNDSIEIVVKTCEDVGIFTGTVNYSNEASIRSAWQEIYSDFLSAMIDPTDDADSFNGALIDPDTNFTDPDTGEPIVPEIHLYPPKKFNLTPSAFAFVSVIKEVTEIDTYIVYDEY